LKEADIQRNIIAAIKKRFGQYCDVTNNHGSAFATAGTPDLTICILGISVYIEVKVPEHRVNGKLVARTEPTELQQRRIKKLSDARAIVGVAYSAEDALALCEQAITRAMLLYPHFGIDQLFT
jgi:hypothetical protein